MAHVRSSEGIDAGPFDLPISVPEAIRWVGRDKDGTVRRDRDLLLRWNEVDSRQAVAVVGRSSDQTAGVSAMFLCLATAEARRLRIPAAILQSLPPSPQRPGPLSGLVFLATFHAGGMPLYSARGLDVVLGIGVSVDGRSVRFK